MNKKDRREESPQKSWPPIFLLGWVIMVLNLVGCTESSTTVSSSPDGPEFTATVSGAVKGEISALGIASYLPPQPTVSGTRPGYYLISNVISNPMQNTTQSMEARNLAITLRIPDGTQPGTYQLTSADPMNLGEEFEARLEAVVDGQPLSFRSNTEGTLVLESFSSRGKEPSDGTLNGEFQFNAENNDGETVSVNGTFNISSAKL